MGDGRGVTPYKGGFAGKTTCESSLDKWGEHVMEISAGRGFRSLGMQVQMPWGSGLLSMSKECRKSLEAGAQWTGGATIY